MSKSVTVVSCGYVHTEDVDPDEHIKASVLNDAMESAVNRSVAALENPTNGYNDFQRRNLQTVFQSMLSTHGLIRKVLSAGWQSPESIDALALARVPVEGLYTLSLMFESPAWIDVYLKDGWKKQYVRLLLECHETQKLKRFEDFCKKTAPRNLDALRTFMGISDQHGFLPDIPLCDLLIVAGDVCPDRFGPFMAVHDRHQQQAWFDREVRPWLAAAPATHRLLTWGNHDWCGQSCSFREDSPAYARSTDLQILVDEATTIPCSDGTKRHVSVWATPWSNRFMRWAFMKKPSELEAVYAAIPEGIHILVSHQPPLYYGDRTFNLDAGRVEHVGSRELLDAVERVRPRIVVCGHVHGGFLSPLMRAGVTATPWRGDDYDIEQMFGPALVRMGIAEGLQGGFLCDLDYRLLADNIDWELVQDLSIHRYSLGQLNRRLILPTRDEEAVRIIADVFQTTRRRGGIIFSPSIAHAREFAAMLRAYGFRAEEISSQDDARLREMKLSRFRGRCKRRCALKRDREPRML